MKKLTAFVLAFGGLLTASATDYLWYAADGSSTGDFNGVYTNTAQWFVDKKVGSGSITAYPTSGSDAVFASRYGSEYTVTFPTDLVVTNFPRFQPTVSPGMKVTFDGSNARFLMPTNAASDYGYQGQVQFGYREKPEYGTVYDLLMVMNNSSGVGSDTAAYKWAPVCDFTDFKYTLESPAHSSDAKGEVYLTFEKGTYDFEAPLGIQWNSGADMPILYLFGGLQNTKDNKVRLDKMEVTMGAEAQLKSRYLCLMGNLATTNVMTYTGGTHVMRSLGFGPIFNGWDVNQSATRQDLILSNRTAMTVNGAFTVFKRYYWYTNRIGRVIVKDNSSLKLDGAVSVTGGSNEILVDHSTLTMDGKGKYDQDLHEHETISLLLAVTNKSSLVLSQSEGMGLYFGSNLGSETNYRHRLWVDDSSMRLAANAKINAYSTLIDLCNGTTVDNCGTFGVRGSDQANGIRSVMTVDSAFVTNRLGGTMSLGQGGAGANLIITNGGEVVYLDSASAQILRSQVRVTAGSKLEFANDAGRIQFRGVTDDPGYMIADGGTILIGSKFFAVGDNTEAHLVATNGGEIVVSTPIHMGGNDGDSSWSKTAKAMVGVIDVMTNGTVRLASDKNGLQIYMGYRPESKGILNVYPGGLFKYYNEGSTESSGLNIGQYGTGIVNLYGGKISVFRSWVGAGAKADYAYSNDVESAVNIYGGEFVIEDENNGSYLGFQFGGKSEDSTLNVRRTRLRLDGGVLTSYATFGGTSSRCRGGTGYTALEADGGTVRPKTVASPCLIHDFDEAKVGEKGLTIDNRGLANALPQHVWADKDGVEGRLIFTGGGSTVVTGDVSQVSYLIADGATLDLSKLANYAVGTLVVTNGGKVVLDPTRTLEVDGAFRLHDTSLIGFSSTVAIGSAKTLLTASAALAPETVSLVQEAMMAARVTGLGADRTAEFSSEAGTTGSDFKMSVRAPGTLRMSVEAGTVSNATETVVYDSVDTLLADVGPGAALTLGGLYRYGTLGLDGSGKLSVDNLDTRVAGSVSVTCGVFEPTVAGTLAKQIAFAATGTNDIFVIKNDVDVTMPIPTTNGTQGEFLKRGTGRLTFEVEGSVNFTGGAKGLIEGSYGTWGTTGRSVNQLAFDAQSGMVTNSGVPAFCVAEGEVRIVGKGTGASVTSKGPLAVGISTKEGTVQPGLVLDNVSFNAGAWGYVSPAINAGGTYARSGDFATEAYLVLTNNATFKCAQFDFARSADGVTPKLIVDGSTFNPGNWFEIGIGPSSLRNSEVVFRNGAKLITRRYIRGEPVPVWFHNTFIANTEHGFVEPIMISTIDKSVVSPSSTAILHLRDGSELHCHRILPQTLNWKKYTPITLDFEDSSWIPVTNVTDSCTIGVTDSITTGWTNVEQVCICVTNGGLRLPVGAGATWTLNQPVYGPGDVNLTGPGTLALGPDAIAFTGVLRNETGTVDFNGKTLAPVIAGCGVFRNGTLAGGIRYTSEEKVPTLDGLAFPTTGRVAFVVPTAETVGVTYTVAGYTGDAAPNVTRLRFKTGTGAALKGAFAVDATNRKITCTTEANGILFILK